MPLHPPNRSFRHLLAKSKMLTAELQHAGESRANLESRRGEVQRLREAIAINRQELNAIAAGRASKARLSQRLADLECQLSLVHDLRASFGKGGVPSHDHRDDHPGIGGASQ